MRVAVIKYGAGNVLSVSNALRRLGVESVVSSASEEIRSADRVIFPGVGEAGSAMSYLNESGLSDVIRTLTQPVLGICLGMQLLFRSSEEGNTDCLGILPDGVCRFSDANGKIPHMGWNSIGALQSALFQGVAAGSRVYFAHSYFVGPSKNTIAMAWYGREFSAAVMRDNFYGVQFHPEKSGPVGMTILDNFLKL